MSNCRVIVALGLAVGVIAGAELLLPDQLTGLQNVVADDATAPGRAGKPSGGAEKSDDMGWIGLMLEDGPDKSVRVANVFPAGPAAFAGVRKGDVLTSVGQTKASTVDAAAKAIEAVGPGKDVQLELVRNGQKVPLTVHVKSLREFHGRYAHEMMKRDPRDPRFHENHGVSEADMSIELVRRLFEQNQRLEYAIHAMHVDLQDLRKEVQSLKK